MIPAFANPSPEAAQSALAAAESGPVVTGVLLLLIGMSVLTWAIVGARVWQARQRRTVDASFMDAFYRLGNLREIARVAADTPDSGPSRMFMAAHEELENLRKLGGAARLSTDALTRQIERALDRATLSLRLERERYLTFLASTASGAPFIGLFGTVWGIMNAFEGIGLMGSASLAVVAPGISEALIATAAGLFAAIPAALAYNYFQRKLDEDETALQNFRLELLNTLEAWVFPDLPAGRGDETGD